MLRSVFFNKYTSVFVTNLGILGISMVTSILLARYLGPTGRGEIAATILWSALLIALGSLGMIESALYFVALPDVESRHVFANAFGMVLIQSAILVPLGYLAMPWLLASQRPEVIEASRAYLIIVPISLFTQYNRSILQGRMKIAAYNLIQIAIPIGSLIGTLALYRLNNLSVQSVVFLLIVLNIVIMLMSLALLLLHKIPIGLEPDLPLARSMLSYGFQVQVGAVFSNANLRLDQVLMAAWVSPEQLGLYVVAVSASSTSGVLSRAVSIVATPAIAKQTDPWQRIEQLQTIFRYYWLSGIVLKVVIALALPWGIPWIYGKEFSGAIVVAEVLLLASLFLDASYVLMAEVRGLGAPWLASRAEIVACGVTVIFLLVLLPSLGILGAAITSLLAYATALGVLVAGMQRCYAISLKELFRTDKTIQMVRGHASRLLAQNFKE